VLLFYWWSIEIPKFWRTWSLPILLGTVVGLLIIGLIFVEPFRVRIVSIFADRKDSSNNFRKNVWESVFQMIRDRPIIGIGPGHGAFNKVYPLYQHPKFTALSAYSVFLETIVETGFLGFTCFMWLIVVALNTGYLQLSRLRKTKNMEGLWLMGAIAAIIGLLTQGLFDTVFYRPEVNTLWWLMMALIASYWQPLMRNNQQA
jgi:putative inorganic carbon (HCO3(-)) transporter